MARTEKYEKDDDGNVIDPPTIPEHETRLAVAQGTGDPDLIAEANENYRRARNTLVDRTNRRLAKEENGG